ncbi:MAG: cobalamin biosynthesis protein [Candidatus Bathyarchaeota archaeon]|nr:cobalamin biosynthesis protein [Candidatus Bathyarchaeota archaeon]
MYIINTAILFDSMLIFTLAFLIDVIFGEIPDRIHPTVWMGKVIAFVKPKIKNKSGQTEKINGIFLCICIILLFAVPTYIVIFLVERFLGWLPYIIVSAIILKSSFALKFMRKCTLSIAEAIERGSIDKARHFLPYIVRRDPALLSERQIISAAVESIAESTTDGVTSPFFYYALFGVPGAVAYRVINTLDSMVGYKDEEHRNIGWFSASVDTIANYVPARLTALLMILAALILGENWRESLRILQRDKGKTASLNAGWTLAAMAGALSVQLEKPGCYKLGEGGGLAPVHIIRALRIMAVTSVLFGVLIVFPILSLKALALK